MTLMEQTIREIIIRRLEPKLAEAGTLGIDDDTNLMGIVLMESVELLDLVIWVEEQAQVEFNPENLNLEDGLTVRDLVVAFVPADTLSAGFSRRRP